jgi:putative tryptophan/tyrosine transport system substrate-binding protein
MKRRNLVLGFAASVSAPLAWAQPSEPAKHVGVLLEYAEADPEAQRRLRAFKDTLRSYGWIESRNLRIEYRFAGGDPDRIRALARELASLNPDLLFGSGAPVTAALQGATRTIPIVFVQASDPVGAGLVPNLARPGGNVTGFTNFEYAMVGKWLETLWALAPNITRVLALQKPANFGWPGYTNAAATTARAFDVEVTLGAVRDGADIEQTLAAFASAPNGGIMVLPDTTTSVHRAMIVELTRRHRLPAVYPFRFFVVEGGLACYGIDVLEVFRRAGSYVDRILRGEKAGDLPIQAPTKFELVINRQTADAIGLTIPPSLLARADEVIE